MFTQKSNIHIFPFTCSAIYPSRLFWSELLSFGHRNACILSNTKELDVAQLVVLNAPKNTFEKLCFLRCGEMVGGCGSVERK